VALLDLYVFLKIWGWFWYFKTKSNNIVDQNLWKSLDSFNFLYHSRLLKIQNIQNWLPKTWDEYSYLPNIRSDPLINFVKFFHLGHLYWDHPFYWILKIFPSTLFIRVTPFNDFLKNTKPPLFEKIWKPVFLHWDLDSPGRYANFETNGSSLRVFVPELRPLSWGGPADAPKSLPPPHCEGTVCQ